MRCKYLTTLAIVFLSGTATAEGEYPEAYVRRPQVLHERMLQLRGDVVLPLHNGTAGQGIVIAPSAEYGITDELQVALRHDRSLCFNKCGDVYKGFGLEAKYLFFHPQNFSLSAFGGPSIDHFDPFFLQAHLGLGFWFGVDKFAVNGNLQVGLGLTNRSTHLGVLGNPDTIALNVQPAYNFTPQLVAFADTGFNGVLDGFGDYWAIPLGVGAFYTIDRKLDLGGDFRFPRLIAASHTGGLDYRQVDLFVRYRFDFSR